MASVLDTRISSGIAGLDDVLGGGLPRNGLYAVQGPPGVGKTTLALQFLMAGRAAGERVLHITLSETLRELTAIARSHRWSIEGIAFYEPPAAARQIEDSPQTMFLPAEVELEEIMGPLFAEIDRVQPARVVIDSVSEIRLMAREPLRYRREVLALKRHFAARNCTVLLLDEMPQEATDILVRSVVHGVILLDKVSAPYGEPRRRISIDKVRGSTFREGFHDYKIRTGGIEVYPRLVAAEHKAGFRRESLPSDIPELDALLGGGLDYGTSTLFIGPAGAGKSTIASRFLVSAAERGHSAIVYTFDETAGTLAQRASSLGMDFERHQVAGRIRVQQVDPAELSPGELSFGVRRAVEEEAVRLVVIDSLNGYSHSMPDEPFLALHLHEMLTYLNQKGVATVLIVAQRGVIGTLTQISVDVTYLADTVLVFRFFEESGKVRQAISVIKKRSGGHERTIRELRITETGVEVGPPLEQFHGVLTGVPQSRSSPTPLPELEDDGARQ